jgi:Uma2 family endonuclease
MRGSVMTAITRETPYITIEEYLEGERASESKHEYTGGRVYAMTGVSATHNLISGNLYTALRAHLRGRPCRVFIGDVKVRLRFAEEEIFYYPDVFVACRDDDRDPYYRRFPNTVIEVLSEATERIDRREKSLAYRTIESLQEYVLVAQHWQQVTIFRRSNEWQAEQLGPNDTLRLDSLAFAMTVAEIYEGVSL